MDDLIKQLHKEEIKKWADSIKSKMKDGGLLFGEPIDLDDPDQVIIFAYELGRNAGKHDPLSLLWNRK